MIIFKQSKSKQMLIVLCWQYIVGSSVYMLLNNDNLVTGTDLLQTLAQLEFVSLCVLQRNV